MWLPLAIGQTLSLALLTDLNRVSRCQPQALNRWQATLTTLALLPLLPFLAWPDNWVFYVLGAANGLAGIFCSAVLFRLSRRNHSRVASLYVPLSAFTAFTTWVLIHPASREALLQNPLALICVTGAFALFTIGMVTLRRSDISLSLFLAVLPVGLIWGLLDVGIKLVLPPLPSLNAALAYLFVVIAAQTIGAWLYQMIRPQAVLETGQTRQQLLWTSMRAAALGGLSFILLVLAIQAAPNPGYPALIGMSMPLWIYVLHKLNRVDDPLRPQTLLLFVVGGALVLLGTL